MLGPVPRRRGSLIAGPSEHPDQPLVDSYGRTAVVELSERPRETAASGWVDRPAASGGSALPNPG